MDEHSIRALPADPRLRTQAAGVAAATIVTGAFGIFLFSSWVEAARLLPPAQAQQQLLRAFLWATGAGVLALMVLAAFLWRTGARTHRAGEYPPPGSRVLRETPVLEGEAALRRARILRMLAVLAALLAVAVVLLAWRLAPLFTLTPR
jgi:hypothetical protein